jgi:hypothetical protein
MTQKTADTNSSTSNSFLDRFVGNWLGEGYSNNKRIIDRMDLRYVLDNLFLRFQYEALEGDTYKGEGYIFFDKDTQQFQWYEFNNGWWPIRMHMGRQDNQSLILEEHSSGRDMRLIFEFLNENTMRMTEAHLRDGRAEVYVDEIFKRQ